ncbi:uncharacterized protein PFL1_04393 [Pseudozyma flocculosa PF-1]|uniref:Integral membrane protein n=1 Tax=Pseudozyma flocculosa PF-1 TaxID=1277687 RepID=A0A061HBU5_9BASI|nr:uncharacterized protein PFL1_04393 [Pseudozyma flocculosa PF-1]EPQ28066.1 hypothetical protein PFL1_04393 [Pseudozyma flocculosa PF-1]
MPLPHPHLPRLPSSIRVRRTETDQRQRAADVFRSQDDERLREEVRLAQRAIRDQEAAGPSSSPSRQQPQFIGGSSPEKRISRSAVEKLAMRHKEMQRQQRKEKKRRQRLSSHSTSGSSAPSTRTASPVPASIIVEPHELSAVAEETTPRSLAMASGADHLDPNSLQGQHSYFTPKRGHSLSPNTELQKVSSRGDGSSGSGGAPAPADNRPSLAALFRPADGISPGATGPGPVPAASGVAPSAAGTASSAPQEPQAGAPPAHQQWQSYHFPRQQDDGTARSGRPLTFGQGSRAGVYGEGEGDVEAQRGRESDDDDDDGAAGEMPTTDSSTPNSSSSDMHEDEVVDYLDVVDPEISTVTTLQNVGNSIFFPPIPMLYSRRPTINLPSGAPRRPSISRTQTAPDVSPSQEARRGSDPYALGGPLAPQRSSLRRNTLTRMSSLMSFGAGKPAAPEVSDEEKRKHISEWADMDEAERNELDEHVEMLLTKKAKFKRAMRGFGKYVRTPMGFILTLYGFLITFWGIAICLFIFKWIDVGDSNRQRYWIEICDQILCALFAAVGLGFAPFRAVDTYRMVQIVHYHRLTYKRRKELNLPKLKDKNELPRSKPRLATRVTHAAGLGRLSGAGEKAPQDLEAAAAPAGTTPGAEAPPAAGHEQGPDQGEGHAAAAAPPGAPVVGTDYQHVAEESGNGSASGTQRNGGSSEGSYTSIVGQECHPLTTVLNDDDDDDNGGGEPGDGRGGARSPASKRRHKQHRQGAGKHEHGHLRRKRVKAKVAEPLSPSYVDKDGVIPLGQLRRTASIASELPKDQEDVVVLSPKQQANLEHQQRKFHESHTFYRYRETITHRPFELRLMMVIVILLDAHSCLQASLGGTTWGIYYKNRPTSVTATIITFSLSCNIIAGIIIWWGGQRTKKTEEVERLLRIALEEEALAKIERRRKRAEEKEAKVVALEGGGRGATVGADPVQEAGAPLGCVVEEDEKPTSPTSPVTPRPSGHFGRFSSSFKR